MANRFLNNIRINDEYTLPAADGTADQIITTDGAGQLSFVDQDTINSGSAERTEILVKNVHGSALSKGDPVYIVGSVGASDRLEVALADAGNAAKMPCVGLLTQDLANNGEGTATVTGKLRNLITSPIDGATPTENDTLYVKSGGGLTLTKPAGSANLIQNVGQVGRVSTSSDGNIVVSAILRSNDVPNLSTGKIWVGTATNTAESGVVHLDESNGRMGIGTISPGNKLEVNSGATNVVAAFKSSDNQAWISVQDDDSGTYGALFGTDSDAGHDIILADSSANKRLVIDSSGNVGIGTTSPGEKLTVHSTATAIQTLYTTNTQGGFTGYHNSTGGVKGFVGYGPTLFSGLDLNNFGLRSQSGMAFATNGGNVRMYITSGGNVGIGETNPGAKLVVDGGSDNLVAVFSSTDDVAQIEIVDNDTSTFLGSKNGLSYISPTAGTPADGLAVSSSGNVGIGETNPSDKLHIVGSNGSVRIDNSSSAKSFSLTVMDSNNRFRIYDNTASSERLTITNGGNVGIGDTSPSYKLSVNGTVQTDMVRGYTYPTNSYIDFDDDDLPNGNSVSLTSVAGMAFVIDSNNNATTDAFYWKIDGTTATGSTIMTLADEGSLQLNNYGSGTFTGTATQRLGVDSSGNVIEIPIGSGAVDGSGSAGQVAFWTDADTISGENSLYWDSTNDRLGIQVTPSQPLDVNGTALIRNTIYVGDDIQHWGDGGTGMYFGTDTISLKNDGGSTRLFVESGGNVGIGETSVDARLHITTATAGLVNQKFESAGSAAWRVGIPASQTYFAFDNANDDLSAPKVVIDSSGQVGIGTTSPDALLRIDQNANATAFKVTGGGSGLAIAEFLRDVGATASVRIHASNAHPTVQMASANNTFSLGVNNTSFQICDNDNLTANARLVIDSSGNVGIGTTSIDQRLHVQGNVKFEQPSGDIDVRYTSNGTNKYNMFYQASTDAWGLYYNPSSAYRLFVSSAGNVGIGTTTPNYKLEATGGALVGGKVSYVKNYGSLDTTGNAVAGITAGYNGAPCNFTFTCTGSTGGYQRIVYSCHCVSTTWNTTKVIDEGTNDFDVEASANGTTITFTFKSTSGTKYYTPTVLVEAFGTSINSTYA